MVQQWHLVPGQWAWLPAWLLLVSLGDLEVVPVSGNDLLRALALGVPRVGGDDHCVRLDAGRQRGHGRDLVALGGHLAWGEDALADAEGDGRQVNRALAVGA
ncbi:hypothetical protein [Kitasatospora kifunensis]|uniref:Uncharacterized protein n=1 Tax=Kitasatospora kifunensis TaxID=58351 RepID=A0A7W7RA97_KITKI|nr:hypothetical protein [Kitasatospora kifunensis]MBB4928239.1 hypothetical protein [Kitasatospora kifunensis]